MKTVCRSLSRSRASVHRDIQRGLYPRPVKVGHGLLVASARVYRPDRVPCAARGACGTEREAGADFTYLTMNHAGISLAEHTAEAMDQA